MDQHFNNSQNEFLWTLLANPANDAHLYAYNFQQLVNDFPQSGILQALLAHASDEKNLRQASVYFNPKSLYKLINAPATFVGVPDEKIIIENNFLSRGHYRQQEDTETVISNHQEDVEDVEGVRYFNEQSLIEIEAEATAEVFHHQHPNEPEADFSVQNLVTGEHQLNEAVDEIPANSAFEDHVENNTTETYETAAVPTPQEPELTHTTVAENAESGIPVENKFNEIHESVSPVEVPVPQEPELIHEPVTGETFDEIVGIEDIGIAPGNAHPSVEIEDAKENRMPEDSPKPDFFMFNRVPGEPAPMAGEDEPKQDSITYTVNTTAENNPVTNDAGHQDVSKYHDEKMPYTFMWWLDKTRREHAGGYQPYIKSEVFNPNNRFKKPTDELQQQYFENIFHITSIEELDKSTAPLAAPLDPKRKEHVIIERFIKEEPQIRPQSSDKLDNENKAKKSSEDRDELVTETLAAIYSDQMLYHKAIASYKKLMLKFPEKSRYFADKIEQLEKKTN